MRGGMDDPRFSDVMPLIRTKPSDYWRTHLKTMSRNTM
jgi:hypothetical protein